MTKVRSRVPRFTQSKHANKYQNTMMQRQQIIEEIQLGKLNKAQIARKFRCSRMHVYRLAKRLSCDNMLRQDADDKGIS